MPSQTTTALSTSMPMAMISAPREIRSSSMPASHITSSVPSTVRNSTAPMITPARRPMAMHSTPTTMATERNTLRAKLFTDSSTMRCCSYSGCSSAPSGMRCSLACSTASTLCPTSTMFAPDTR